MTSPRPGSHYDTLGVRPDVGAAEIRRAYLGLARRHHPDAGGDPARMRDLNAAFAVLSDPARRRAYDLGTDGAAATDPSRPHAWSAGAGGDVDPGPLSGADVADLLDDRPYAAAPLRSRHAMAPPALFATSIGAACVFLVTGHRAVLAAAGILAFLAVLSIAALALFALTRSARATR